MASFDEMPPKDLVPYGNLTKTEIEVLRNNGVRAWHFSSGTYSYPHKQMVYLTYVSVWLLSAIKQYRKYKLENGRAYGDLTETEFIALSAPGKTIKKRGGKK